MDYSGASGNSGVSGISGVSGVSWLADWLDGGGSTRLASGSTIRCAEDR